MKTYNIVLIILTSFFLASCSTIQELKLLTLDEPRPTLVVPEVDQLDMDNITWVIVTPENVQEIFQDLKDKNIRLALFSLTSNGYQAISINNANIIKLIKQQESIIAAYEQYYEAEE